MDTTSPRFCRDEGRAWRDLRFLLGVGALSLAAGAGLAAKTVARLLRGGPVPTWVDALFGTVSLCAFGALCVFGVLVILVALTQYRASAGVCYVLTPEGLRREAQDGAMEVPWGEITHVTYCRGLLRFREHDTYRIAHARGVFLIYPWVEQRECLVDTVRVRMGELPEDWLQGCGER